MNKYPPKLLLDFTLKQTRDDGGSNKTIKNSMQSECVFSICGIVKITERTRLLGELVKAQGFSKKITITATTSTWNLVTFSDTLTVLVLADRPLDRPLEFRADL
jgi:hypothetical protein